MTQASVRNNLSLGSKRASEPEPSLTPASSAPPTKKSRNAYSSSGSSATATARTDDWQTVAVSNCINQAFRTCSPRFLPPAAKAPNNLIQQAPIQLQDPPFLSSRSPQVHLRLAYHSLLSSPRERKLDRSRHRTEACPRPRPGSRARHLYCQGRQQDDLQKLERHHSRRPQEA